MGWVAVLIRINLSFVASDAALGQMRKALVEHNSPLIAF